MCRILLKLLFNISFCVVNLRQACVSYKHIMADIEGVLAYICLHFVKTIEYKIFGSNKHCQ